MRSGHSSESLSSNTSTGRTDSYRVALLQECDVSKQKHISKFTAYPPKTTDKTNRTVTSSPSQQPYRKSLTAAPEDDVSRADSYRCAMRNTHTNILGDMSGRNCSYRLATFDDDVVTDNRMDACNLWTGKTGGTRDVRRMGITDVDQLKSYDAGGGGKNSSKKNPSKTGATIHVRKKLAVNSESESKSGSKTPPSEHKRLVKTNSKDKCKLNKNTSSTYIRFDPIFESGEDLRASTDSLRPPSITSLRTLTKVESQETLMADCHQGPASPARKRASTPGRRSGEDRSGLSLLGSIKTTIKSMSGGKGE